jgi:hypothetical protein
VEERFLFDRIDLNSGHIPEGYIEHPVPVEANLADTIPAWLYLAPVAARVTSDPAVGHLVIQFPFPYVMRKDTV